MPCETPYRDDSEQRLLFKIASCINDGSFIAGVASFNGRSGVVTLTAADVSAALGCTPLCQSDGDARYVLKTGDTMTGQLTINTAASSLLAMTSDAGVSNKPITVEIFHETSGVPIAAFGNRLEFTADTNGGSRQPQARIDTDWTDATDATRTSRMTFGTRISGAISTDMVLNLGQVHFRNGTAAAPSITFQDGPDTGLYRIGVGSFGASAGGSLILATSTTGINLTTALAYQYNSVNVIRAQTALNNYFFGPSGNLTMTGTLNTSVGSFNFNSNTTGSENTSVGAGALFVNTTGSLNVAIGRSSLLANINGAQNVAIGASALAANTSGNNNVAVGYLTLLANTTGGNNVAIGRSALASNTTGSSQTAIGFQALASNVGGQANSAFGLTSLFSNVAGDNNSAFGVEALNLNTGSGNSAFGRGTLMSVTSGSNNTAIGYNTGLGITTGSGNTIVGAQVAGLAAALSNNIILADGAGAIRLQIDSSGNTSLAGNLSLATAKTLSFASGANTRAGNATLVAGTVTVANTSVTANTIVMLTRKTSGGTLGTAITYTVIAATSFTINSDSALDTSTFSYVLIENP